MKRTFRAGILSATVFLLLVGLLWGYAVVRERQAGGHTHETGSGYTEQTGNTTQETAGSCNDTTAAARPTPDLSLLSPYVFVYDTETDTILFSQGQLRDRIRPASLTKLFSAYVALQYIDPATVITAGEEVTWIDEGSSVAFIYRGQRVTVAQCVEGMLLQSGNDAAYILAVAAGRAIRNDPTLSANAALGVFVGQMNDTASQLGLTDTHFANPDGIDMAGHYTSLRDLAQISRLAMETPLIRQYAATVTDSVTYVSGELIKWRNTNALLHPESEFYCAAACGLKTGSTAGAGKCLISAFHKDGGYLIIGALGSQQEDDRYIDALNLYRYYS